MTENSSSTSNKKQPLIMPLLDGDHRTKPSASDALKIKGERDGSKEHK
jgi:hypothetical protein